MMPCEKTWTRCFAFFSSHVCIHRPSFSYCIFVLHACSVSSASKILLLFTWRSHNVFGRVIAVTIFFPLLSSVVILSEHRFQAGILSCRSFFFLMEIIVHYALFGVWCKNKVTCFVSLCEHFFILNLLIVTWSLLPKKWLHTTGARMGIPFNFTPKRFNTCCIHAYFALLI